MAVMVVVDLIVLPLCLLSACYLRLGDTTLVARYGLAPPIIMGLATVPIFYVCGLYHNVVRYIDASALKLIVIGLTLSAVCTFAAVSLLTDAVPPRSSFFIYWLIAFAYVIVSRYGARAVLRPNQARSRREVPRVAVYGAGEAGVQLVNAMRTSRAYWPVCFFDDDRSLHRTQVAGLKVYAPYQAKELVQKCNLQQIIIAMPSASPQRRREIVHMLQGASALVRTLPPLAELVEGKVSDAAIRDVQVEDLLGRPPVPPRQDLFARCVSGKVVLVTGAGGSIGSELCRQIATQKPAHIVLLDHSEFALYTIEQELRQRFPELRVSGYLGTVCDEQLVRMLLRTHHVQTIYHAAAYKHVPLVEINPAQGILNNVKGTLVVAQAAAEFGVETCVLISTDKAVRPTNVMGATKRCAELIFQAFAQRPDIHTVYSMVRFGNVLGSSGSVVPLFKEQIRKGGPVTVTHPDVTRYFMLIPEAAQLVIQAGAMAKGGEVFVLDMGEPVRIMDLARTMIELSGLTEKTAENPAGDIEIRITGLRPGEKLYEELLIGGEVEPSEHPRIMRSREISFGWDALATGLARLFCACETFDDLAMQVALQALVDEYAPYSQYPPMQTKSAGSAEDTLVADFRYEPANGWVQTQINVGKLERAV